MVKSGDQEVGGGASADQLDTRPLRRAASGGTTGVSMAALVVVVLIAAIWFMTRGQALHGVADRAHAVTAPSSAPAHPVTARER